MHSWELDSWQGVKFARSDCLAEAGSRVPRLGPSVVVNGAKLYMNFFACLSRHGL